MLIEERYEKILEILKEKKYVLATELSEILFVSMPTIRRDLAQLQKRNLIIRTHGGAKYPQTDNTVLPLISRKSENFPVKRKLCEKASECIEYGDVIFIDASSTLMQIVDFIDAQRSVTVVTNSIYISTVLTRKNVIVYLTGGEFQENSNCYAGDFAIEFVKKFNYDKVFFSSHGINNRNMIVDASLAETQLRREAIKQAKKTVFVCDSSKYNVNAPYNLVAFSDVDEVITNIESDCIQT